METKKATGIIAGVGAGLFLVGLILGYIAFDDSGEVRKLREELDAARKEKERALGELQEAKEKELAALRQEKEQVRADLEETRKRLSGQVAALTAQLEAARKAARAEKRRLEAEVERLTEQVRALQAKEISGPRLPELVDRLNKVWPAYVGFSLRALELKNALALARVAPPDVAAVKDCAREILEYVKTYAAQSRDVLEHVRLARAELRKVGIEPDVLERRFSPQLEKVTRELADLVGRVVEKTVKRTVDVEASVRFTDCGLKAEPGDLLFFSASGSWQMSSEMDISDATGWDNVPNHLKLAPGLRGGALVCKVGVSEAILPAYGRMPVVCKESGLLRLAMNDKRLDDNVGRLTVTIIRVPGAELAEFEKFWEKKLKPLLR